MWVPDIPSGYGGGKDGGDMNRAASSSLSYLAPTPRDLESRPKADNIWPFKTNLHTWVDSRSGPRRVHVPKPIVHSLSSN